MTQWEYMRVVTNNNYAGTKIENHEHDFIVVRCVFKYFYDNLNVYGAEGWEAFSQYSDAGGYTYTTFKRPKPPVVAKAEALEI